MKMRKLYRVMIVVLVMVMLAMVAVPAGAAESSPTVRVTWVLNVSFLKGQVIAERQNSLYIGQNLRLQWTDDWPEILCTPVGNVSIGFDTATFNGGHIECDLSSLKQSTSDESGGRAILADTCNLTPSGFLAYGRVNITDPDFSSASSLPLISHSDFNTSLYLNDEGASQGSLTFSSGTSRTTTSLPFNLLGGTEQTVGSRINACSGGNCTGKHFLDNLVVSQETIPDEVSASGTSLETTIFIGYDGVDVFQGTMGDIEFDPGCVANSE